MMRNCHNRVRFTKREAQVAILVCRGKTNEEIGKQLFLTTDTCKQYLARIYSSLGISGRLELMLWGLQHPNALYHCEWTPVDMHPVDCSCDAIYCSAVRKAIQNSPVLEDMEAE